MGLFKNKGRADIEAWAKALIQGYKKGMPVDRSVCGKGKRNILILHHLDLPLSSYILLMYML